MKDSNMENYIAADSFIKKIISDSDRKPLKLWYGLYFHQLELKKEFPKAGYAFLKERQFNSKKHNNKKIHEMIFYIDICALKTTVKTKNLYEADPPYNFLESESQTMDEKNDIISKSNVVLNNDTLRSVITEEKNKLQRTQDNVRYSLNNELGPSQWILSKNRKIGDKKNFICLSEYGTFDKETYEIINIKQLNSNTYTTSTVTYFDSTSGLKIDAEYITNEMNICHKIDIPEYFLNAKLEKKEKALEKLIH